LSHSERKLEKKVLAKAIMYISVTLIIWIPTFLAVLGLIFVEHFDWANVFLCLLLPFQGGFNALIYSGKFEKCLEKLICCISDSGSAELASRSFTLRHEGVLPDSALSTERGSHEEKVDS